MQTSNFWKAGKNSNAVSIAARAPSWYRDREYKKLAPKYWLLMKYKKDKDSNFYTAHYYEEILNKLDPQKTFNELGKDAILLCWEKSGEFCHRHLVSQWLSKNLGIKIQEVI